MAVRGVKKVRANLKNASVRMTRAVDAALYQVGLEIDADAVMRTPVDTGRLRSSHYVSPPVGDPSVVQIGSGTDYAVPVHERTGVGHTVGEAKYLQNAVDAAKSDMAANIARKAADNFKAGIGVTAIPAAAPTAPKDRG